MLKIKKSKSAKERGHNLNTIVTETTEFGEMPIDIYQKLSNDRILFVNDDLDDKLASDLCATLLLKDSESSLEKITLFINCEHGDPRNAFMIYDVMRMIECPIETICIGSAMDECTIILAAGSPGMRFATQNSAIAVGPLVSNHLRFSDINNAKQSLDQVVRDNKRMMEAIARHSGKSYQETIKFFDKRVFLTPAAAVKRGIIDKVISSNKKEKNVKQKV